MLRPNGELAYFLSPKSALKRSGVSASEDSLTEEGCVADTIKNKCEQCLIQRIKPFIV